MAEPSRMVKAMARSAAGQDAPLPQDIRSVRALQRTLMYLIHDLLRDDDNLPSMHNFLWDRTRAIRRDFVFHSLMSADEMAIQVYVLENITRFHVTALHLLSRKGFAAEGFSQQQELEQLGKSLLSLTQAYDDCKAKNIRCENEAEFRAYSILFNANDPNVHQHLQENPTLWFDSDEVSDSHLPRSGDAKRLEWTRAPEATHSHHNSLERFHHLLHHRRGSQDLVHHGVLR